MSDTSSIASTSRNGLGVSQETELKGWLHKWTNYLKGYQKRWFILANGTLSYYRNPSDISQSCRGTINLISAVIHTEDSCNFVIASGAHTYHLRATNESERQKWVSVLELVKARTIREMDAEEEDLFELENDPDEIQTILKGLQTRLDSLTTCIDVVAKHGTTLQRALTELEQMENASEAVSKMKAINERATLYRITSSAMKNAGVEYLYYAQGHSRKLQKQLQHERETRIKLEELVEQLAKQHSNLEQRAIQQQHWSATEKTNDGLEAEEEEFYDAEENAGIDFFVTFPGKAHKVTSNGEQTTIELNDSSVDTTKSSMLKERNKLLTDDLTNESGNSNDDDEDSATENIHIDVEVRSRKSLNSSMIDIDKTDTADRATLDSLAIKLNDNMIKTDQNNTNIEPKSLNISESSTSSIENGISNKINIRKRRTAIPFRPNHSLNLWSILKNCIGKELTKIPMPVNFNEPLSMLQRMTEEFEYADLLHKAASIDDSLEQMIYVAAFSVTCYATTSTRTNKPFNPLLGESFECDRMDDLGWRCISEQVSHHPPMLAQYCDSKTWSCWREFSMNSKFRGKYLSVIPVDITHLEFANSGNHYTWKKVITTVNNIIVGKLWVDNHGEMQITNHKTGDVCHLNFHQYSYFSRDIPRKVTGLVVNKSNEIKWVLQGTWDSKIEAAKVLNSSQKVVKGSKPMVETGSLKNIWKRVYPPEINEKMYNLTKLAIELNELEPGIAPTDSRLRPDQRLMEEAKWDEANERKAQLEERQRLVRREREEAAEKAANEGRPYMPYEPIWFKKTKDPITGNPVHMYTHEYWQCKQNKDWSKCPIIYD